MRRLSAFVIGASVCLLHCSTAAAQTFEPRPFPKTSSAAIGLAAAPASEPQLLPQAGIEVGNQKPTISVQALRLHVKGHPKIKLYVVSGLPAVTDTPAAGQTTASKPAESLQRALIDGAGGIVNVTFSRLFEREFFSADLRAGGKLIEVPDQGAGYTVRPVGSASLKLEFRVPLEDEQNADAGSIFLNATGVYNYLQDDVASRFVATLKNQNFNISGAAGIDLPVAHLYAAFVFSVYKNDGQFGNRYAVTLNPHR